MSKFFQPFIFLLKKVKGQQGVSLYLSIMIMVILLSIVLGMSGILLGQLKMMKGIENSVIAFYAADTGIEKVLVQRGSPIPLDGTSGELDNGASYEIKVFLPGSNCNAANFCISSVGIYKGTQRAIQVSY